MLAAATSARTTRAGRLQPGPGDRFRLADAYVNRGDIELQKHELDKVLADCDKGLRLDPKFAKGYLVRGLVWSDKGELDRALGLLGESPLDCTPANSRKLLNNVGVGSWQKAQEQDRLAARAEAAGDLQAAKASRGDVHGA